MNISTRCLIVGLFLCATRGTWAADLGYYQQPALHEHQLVFASEGDLWTTSIAGDRNAFVAYRLTSSDGVESHPQLSPDGSLLAFAAEYEGNRDIYVMPTDGGAPRRVTFHPGDDVPLGWTPDGTNILFRSARAQPLGRDEVWQVSVRGGMPRRRAFGECSMISVSPTGRRFAFTRWSNERWHWKQYRGGRAPEIWVGDLAADDFSPLTNDPGNDMFPMWLAGRIYFTSDRAGVTNLFSNLPQGGDLRQHTRFAGNQQSPIAIEGYDVRWPSASAERGGTRIVFCQGGSIALFDTTNDAVRRLDIRLATDRVAARRRFTSALETLEEIALSPDGTTLLLGTRGEVLSVDVETQTVEQMTRTSAARERGFNFLGGDQIVLITDAGGEQQIAVMPADGTELPSLATEDREHWLFPPATAPNLQSVAFADSTMRLHLLNMQTLVRTEVRRAEAGEITDYRFSPDGQWLAWAEPRSNGNHQVFLYSLQTQRTFPVTDGTTDDREPRWDPAGRHLYFLSDRHLDPVTCALDFEHVYLRTTQVVAVPLQLTTPPPIRDVALAAGFDLKAWATAPEPDGEDAEREPMLIDTDGMTGRQYLLPIEAGTYRGLEATWGGVTLLSDPVRGLLDRRGRGGGLGTGRATIMRHDLVEDETTVIADGVDGYVCSADRSTLAHRSTQGVVVRPVKNPDDRTDIDCSETQVRVDVGSEWTHVLAEAWRLQRDFYWAPNFGGINWTFMRSKYDPLAERVGTRAELNDVVGEMMGELRTSHTYIWGGERHHREEVEPVSVGLLGADVEFDGRGFRITRILPRHDWGDDVESPLAAPHMGVSEGNVILAVNEQPMGRRTNLYDLLQDQADRIVRLTIADDVTGANRRTVRVRALSSERMLRYLDWVETNRRAVDEATEGRVGYVHIPDMSGRGVSMFARQFYAQHERQGMIIDVRNNGGGFASQMLLERLTRTVDAYFQPRHGVTVRYPRRAPHAHMVALIDQHAGSDGDIFPMVFRHRDLGPLIGTRTWGGVIGIRNDKPFVDLGMSTQPEFAWWDDAGWSIENVGVAPDEVVELTPSDRIAGRDPQLDAGIASVVQRLEFDPMQLPEPPPYPEH